MNLSLPVGEDKRPKIKLLAGSKRLSSSNLCQRHIPEQLKPRGHHDWPENAQTLI